MSRISVVCLALVSALLLASPAVAQVQLLATARMFGTVNMPSIYGMVYFNSIDGSTDVNVTVDLYNVPEGLHGLHVHTFGDLSDLASTNGHWNPLGSNHGCYPNTDRHFGDIGNVTADASGRVEMSLVRDLLSFTGGISAIGRSVVLHTTFDNCVTPNTGNAGIRLATGVIGRTAVYSMGFNDIASSAMLVARVKPTAGQSANGTVYFWLDSVSGLMKVYGRFMGLKPGMLYGVHVHTLGDLTDGSTAVTTVSGHYNPLGMQHALPVETEDRHAGAMGNMLSSDTGSGYFYFETALLNTTGPVGILGRGFILHALNDQGSAVATNGGSGARIGFATIGLSNTVNIAMDPAPTAWGIARIVGTPNGLYPAAAGYVTFMQLTYSATIRVTVSVSGLPANSTLGIHIHQYGNILDNTGTATGGHWNPTGGATTNAPIHACPNAGNRHFGAMGNWTVDGTGTISQTKEFQLPTLWGYNSIIGRAVVIHGSFDDCTTQPSGNSGPRIAYGVIGITNPNNASLVNTAGNPNVYNDGAILSARLMGTMFWPSLNGTVWFWRDAITNSTMVAARVWGLVVGRTYGIHVHTYGDLSPRGGVDNGLNAGSHFNPMSYNHALPVQSEMRHAGDLGNMVCQEDGWAYLWGSYPILPFTDIPSIVGRGVVVHQLPDQGNVSTTTGNAGDRWGFGVIGISGNTVAPTAWENGPYYLGVATFMPVSLSIGNVTGKITFEQTMYAANSISANLTLSGIVSSTGYVQLRITDNGDVVGVNATGNIFNPYASQVMGCYPSGARPTGSLGIYPVDANGNVNAQFTLDQVVLFGMYSILGRTVVVSMAYDCTTWPMDTMYDAVAAYGVIGAGNPAYLATPVVATNSANNYNGIPIMYTTAVALMQGSASQKGVTGYVYFNQTTMGDTPETSFVTVYARFSGLAPLSVHGLHVHGRGDLTDMAAGGSLDGHFNPYGGTHMLPDELSAMTSRHVGDMGNVYADQQGKIYFYQTFNLQSLFGMNSIIGRGVVLHQKNDEGNAGSPTTGNAGSRYAFGVIGVSAATPPAIQYGSRGLAVARMNPLTANTQLQIAGLVYLEEDGNNPKSNVVVTVSLTGLTPSSTYAIHIHTWGDTVGNTQDGANAGGHYNPYGMPHGCYPDATRHMGDLGNITSDANGAVEAVLLSSLVSVFGNDSVVGRSILIHANPDDCVTQATGNAGARIAIGIIGIANTVLSPQMEYNAWTSGSSTTVVSKLRPTTNIPGCSGDVWFRVNPSDPTMVDVYARINNLAIGANYGFHIHRFGDYSSLDGNSASDHYNPYGGLHALPAETFVTRMAGEMGNVVSQSDGQVYFRTSFSLMQLTNYTSVVGRAVVVHSNLDYGATRPTPPNQRLCMGVIGFSARSFPTTFDTAPYSSVVAVIRLAVGDFNPNSFAIGTVRIVQVAENSSVVITYNINPNVVLLGGAHAMHVHTTGDAILEATTEPSTRIFDPLGNGHNCYPATRQLGSLGNIIINNDGSAMGSFSVDLVTTFGANSILGRVITIKANADNCLGDTDGGAGAVLAAGVLGIETSAQVPNTADNTGITANTILTAAFESAEGVRGHLFLRTSLTNALAVEVAITLDGLTPGLHGIHIHQYGDLRNYPANPDNHYNPLGKIHALPSETTPQNRHGGDMGNIEADDDGSVRQTLTLQLAYPLNFFVGRAIVVKANPDNGQSSQPSGSSGSPVVWGVLGLTDASRFASPVLNAAPGSTPSFLTVILAALAAAFLLARRA
jgi:superoxide dismutase, Cu-Zn family